MIQIQSLERPVCDVTDSSSSSEYSHTHS